MKISKRKAGTAAAAQSADARSLISPQVRRILDDFRLADVGSHLLRRAHFIAEELFMQEFAKEAITPRQKAALVMLYQHPGISQHALADRLFMDRNTVAEMVKRMSAGGLMRRMASPTDQRAYQLFLGPDGAALLNRVMPHDVALEQRLLERLPAEYRPLFLKCIRLIIERPVDDDVAPLAVEAPDAASTRTAHHA